MRMLASLREGRRAGSCELYLLAREEREILLCQSWLSERTAIFENPQNRWKCLIEHSYCCDDDDDNEKMKLF